MVKLVIMLILYELQSTMWHRTLWLWKSALSFYRICHS